MNGEIQKFDFRGASLRTLTDEAGEPWFVAKDVCDVLELSNVGQALARLDDDEKSSITLNDGTPGNPNRAIVSESGLYALVLASRKPEAHEFKRWVTHEVLPSIRKHGGYMAGQERMTPEQMALASMRWLQSKVDEQAKQLKAQEGKVLFANAVESAKTSILVGDLAKILKGNGVDIGQKRLFAWLREHGWLIKARGSSWNMPTQKSMDLGLFEIKETTVTHADGHTTINKTPKGDRQGADVLHQPVPQTHAGGDRMSRRADLPVPPRAVLVPCGRHGFAMRIHTGARQPGGELIQLTAGEPIVLTKLTAGELETFSYELANETGATR